MTDDHINTESLLLFALVVRERSISSAAQKLGRTKQSVHRQIKNFEESLSVKLFEKVKRNIVPTKIGQRLYQHAERIIDEKRAISEYLRLPKSEASPTLRLTAPPLLAEVFLNSILNEFCIENESVRFECSLSNDVLNLEENDIDLAIRIGKFPEAGLENYQVVLLGTASRVICASPKYIQKSGKPKSIQDLKNHRILHFGSLNELKRAHWKLSKSVELLPVLSASSPRLILDAALKGQGIAMLPEMLCANDLRQKKLIEVLPQNRVENIPISVCVRKSISQTSLLFDFIRKIQDATKKSNSWLKSFSA